MDKKDLIKKKLKAKRNGNMRELANATNHLADFYFQLGHLEAALDEYNEEINVCDVIGDKLNAAVAHRMIGEIHASLGEYEDALKHQNLHLAGAKEVKNDVEEQRALATLGRTYFCLAESLPDDSEERKKALADARKAYTKSIILCDKLKDIPKLELMTMRARLLLNQGLVQEAQMEPNEGIKLINSAIEICSKNKLDEDLYRAHLALGALQERQGNVDLALEHLDLAIQIGDITMKANAVLAKSELLLKIGEWRKARKALVEIYPNKNLSQSTKEQLEKLLRIAVTLCRGEDKLNSSNSELNKFKTYEDLGDAASAARSYDKALEYYKNMLYHAEKDKSNDGIAAALVSLAQTLKDSGKYNEALIYARRELNMCFDPKEQYRSALFLADLSESAGLKSSNIIDIYKLAVSKAEITGDPALEVTALKEYLHYLESQKSENFEMIKNRLDTLVETIPEIESEKEIIETPDIGADIYLDELSDLELPREDGTDRTSRPRSTRRRIPVIKKNEKGETQLHVACINGNLERVEKLIKDGHSINVRDNYGWTPLHEAANHGFVDIVKILLNAGADANDRGGPKCKGITPLHDAASCGNFSVINLLIDKGADIYAVTEQKDSILDSLEEWRKRVEDLTPADETEFEYLRSKLIAKKVPRQVKGNLNTDKNFYNTQNRNRISLDDVDEDFQTKSTNAGEDYKRTIAVLRDRGARLPVLNKINSVENLAPLLDSEQILEDEWLDDDIGINTNRKKKNFNELLPTAKRKSVGSANVGERETKRQKIASDEEEENCDIIDVDILDSISQPDEIKKRKKQSSLMSAGFSRLSVSRTPSPILNVMQKIESQIEELNLSVSIEDKFYKLKLNAKTEEKITALSIVNEVKKQFENETGCVPSFQLLMSNGDIFSPDDNLERILTTDNPINLNSKIINIEIPPIYERYKRICSSWNIDVKEGTIKCLKICENSSMFRLKSSEIFDEEILPLLKSLEYQIRLQVLHLSGGSLNDYCNIFNDCLKNFNSLQELYVRCCDLDYYCLKKIDKLPSQIRVLDIGYNPMGNKCAEQLLKLLSPLKNLQTLNMKNCKLENILKGTTNVALTNLDVSFNSINQNDFEHFLQPHMLALNLSGNKLTKTFIDRLTSFLYTLETIELSSCDIDDNDIEIILSHSLNLNRILVNGNSKLTNKSVANLLRHVPTISYIDISGCDEVKESPESDVHISKPDICTLIVTMNFECRKFWLDLWRGYGSIDVLPHNVVIFNKNS